MSATDEVEIQQAHAEFLGQQARALVRNAVRRALQRGRNHPLDVLIQDAARHARGGASLKLSMPCWAKRRRHLPTVKLLMPRRAATAKLVAPGSEQPSTMLARSARPWAVKRQRVHKWYTIKSLTFHLGSGFAT